MCEKINFTKIRNSENYPKQTTITFGEIRKDSNYPKGTVKCVVENHPKPGITKTYENQIWRHSVRNSSK